MHELNLTKKKYNKTIANIAANQQTTKTIAFKTDNRNIQFAAFAMFSIDSDASGHPSLWDVIEYCERC